MAHSTLKHGDTSTGHIVRLARPDELATVSAVIRAAYAEYLPNIPEERRARYLDRTADVWGRLEESDLLVCELDGQIVGTITFFPPREGASVQGWPEGWAGLRVLGVHPDARGRGVGRALVAGSIQRARDLGAIAVGLHTTEMMAIARDLYERMGFMRVPEYDFHPATMEVYAYRFDLLDDPK
jgi:predicted N-acetyltransferase YhbS